MSLRRQIGGRFAGVPILLWFGAGIQNPLDLSGIGGLFTG